MGDYSRMSLIEAIFLQRNQKNMYSLAADKEYREYLAKTIEDKIPAESATTLEWNEVLHLICRCGPENSQETARQRVLSELRCR